MLPVLLFAFQCLLRGYTPQGLRLIIQGKNRAGSNPDYFTAVANLNAVFCCVYYFVMGPILSLSLL